MCLFKLTHNGSAAWRGAGLSALKPIRITNFQTNNNMSNEAQNPASCQTAVSGSALIAEFMKDEQCTPYWVNLRAGVEGEYYKTSWNWLMPVLEKICRLKIGDGIETVDYPNLRTFGMINEETGSIMVRLNGFQVFEAETLIESTFLAVVDFLEWWSKADR